ncbi:hypothetical protein G3I18_26555, partial [Actinospica acidiphila]
MPFTSGSDVPDSVVSGDTDPEAVEPGSVMGGPVVVEPPGVPDSVLRVGGADVLGSAVPDAVPVGPAERGGAVDPVAGSGRSAGAGPDPRCGRN